MTTYVAIGMMSGTSLDGVDVCLASFTADLTTDIWTYAIKRTKTYPYDEAWTERLSNVGNLCGEDLIRLHVDYGHHLGSIVRSFIEENRVEKEVQLIASHGHTAFHQPLKRQENNFAKISRGILKTHAEGYTNRSRTNPCQAVSLFNSAKVKPLRRMLGGLILLKNMCECIYRYL